MRLAFICRYLLDDTIFQVQYNMPRAHLSSLPAWGPLPTRVIAPLTPLTRRAADSESDDGLVMPLRTRQLSSRFCTMRTGIQGITETSFWIMTVNVLGCRTLDSQVILP